MPSGRVMIVHACLDGGAAPTLLGKLEALNVCCVSAAEYGPHRCTCWEPVYDLEQQPVPRDAHTAADINTRTTMCADCAFRPTSPERQGDERYSHSGDEGLEELTHFWCHQGMRKPIAWRHPAGITIDADTDAYDPLIRIVDCEGVPFKADGTPADRCAGFAAHHRDGWQ